MDADLWLSITTAVAGTILVARLLFLGQVGRYRGLTFYLTQHVLWGYILSIVPRKGNQLYVWLYEASNPIEWIAAICCVVCLLDKAFDAYPGIRTLSRWATWVATTISVAIALTITRLFWNGSRARGRLFYFEVADRSVLLSLALVILLTLAFLSRYPLRLQMDVRVSLIGFSVVVLSLAGARLMDSLAALFRSNQTDRAELLVEIGTYLIWAWLLQREEAQAPARVIFHHPDEAELLAELDAMNGVLQRAGKG